MRLLSALLHDEWFRSLVSIVIGFLMAQLTGYSADRKERRKAVSSALSDLLIVRHQLFGLEDVVDRISVIGNVPEHEKSQLRVIFNSLLPKWEELHSRYDHSVTTLASLDPVLAFELRSKDIILPSLNTMHSLMAQDPHAAALVGPIFKTKLLNTIEPVLNKSVISLAKQKSLFCWYQTRRLVKKGNKMPDELAGLLDQLKATIEAAKNTTAGAQGVAVNKPS